MQSICYQLLLILQEDKELLSFGCATRNVGSVLFVCIILFASVLKRKGNVCWFWNPSLGFFTGAATKGKIWAVVLWFSFQSCPFSPRWQWQSRRALSWCEMEVPSLTSFLQCQTKLLQNTFIAYPHPSEIVEAGSTFHKGGIFFFLPTLGKTARSTFCLWKDEEATEDRTCSFVSHLACSCQVLTGETERGRKAALQAGHLRSAVERRDRSISLINAAENCNTQGAREDERA